MKVAFAVRGETPLHVVVVKLQTRAELSQMISPTMVLWLFCLFLFYFTFNFLECDNDKLHGVMS